MERIGQLEERYVKEVLQGQFSSKHTYGMVTRLERAFADKFGVSLAVAMTYGTATLHIALEAAGVKPADEVVCPPLTMSSTSLAVLMADAVPVFADVDRNTFEITAENIKKVITEKTKAVITVSLYGLSPQMNEIVQLAHSKGIAVIEDNAECYGAYQNGRMTGTFGDMASYSFQSSKHLTAGEGGIVITDNDDLADRLRKYSGLGYAGISGRKGRITKDDIQHPSYERHAVLGWNYRMSDLCAAVALGQLERMDELTGYRCKSAAYYLDAASGCTWLTPQQVIDGNIHSYWTCVMLLDTEKVSWEEFRRKYMEYGGDGIYAAWKLSYQEPVFRNKAFLGREKFSYYENYNYEKTSCPNAEYLQPRLLQFKTNYLDKGRAEDQAKILKQTIDYFGRN